MFAPWRPNGHANRRPNLPLMKPTDDPRVAIARGWGTSPLSQTAYASAHQISPRTLRSWVKRYCPPRRADADALAIIDAAIAELTALRQRLAAAFGVAMAAPPPGSATGQQAVADSDVSSPPTPAPVPPATAERRPTAVGPGAIDRQVVPAGTPRPAPVPCPPPSASFWLTGG